MRLNKVYWMPTFWILEMMTEKIIRGCLREKIGFFVLKMIWIYFCKKKMIRIILFLSILRHWKWLAIDRPRDTNSIYMEVFSTQTDNNF